MQITRFRIARSSGLHPIRANYLVNTEVALNADSPEISLTVIKFSYARYRNIYDIYAGEVHWRGSWREEQNDEGGREKERRGGNGVKTARWVILPTCSYSYQHMALLITSNYNTCKQCILRYANLVSPLLVLMHSAEVGKLGTSFGCELNVVYSIVYDRGYCVLLACRNIAKTANETNEPRPLVLGHFGQRDALFSPKFA